MTGSPERMRCSALATDAAGAALFGRATAATRLSKTVCIISPPDSHLHSDGGCRPHPCTYATCMPSVELLPGKDLAFQLAGKVSTSRTTVARPRDTPSLPAVGRIVRPPCRRSARAHVPFGTRDAVYGFTISSVHSVPDPIE